MHQITHFFLGLDLGQRRDHSALVALALVEHYRQHPDPVTWSRLAKTRLELVHAVRLSPGLPYIQVPNRVKELAARLDATTPFPGSVNKYMAVDAGGPGIPVIELLRRHKTGIELKPIVITSGNTPASLEGGYQSVPRRLLITNFRLMIESGALAIHKELHSLPEFKNELAAIKFQGDQQERDDMAIAASLAAWHATRVIPGLLKLPTAPTYPHAA